MPLYIRELILLLATCQGLHRSLMQDPNAKYPGPIDLEVWISDCSNNSRCCFFKSRFWSPNILKFLSEKFFPFREGQLKGEWSYRKGWGQHKMCSILFFGARGRLLVLSSQGHIFAANHSDKTLEVLLHFKVRLSLPTVLNNL